MNCDYPAPIDTIVLDFNVLIDNHLGHLCVAHDGTITWDQLQAIKAQVWGAETRAIEVYPAVDMTINKTNLRHLWRLGDDDFCPDLLGRSKIKMTLERRFERAWEAKP